jgi:hypothetical protein
MVGRFAWFFWFGVREYGIHPTSKALKLLNHVYLGTVADCTNTYPVMKSLF